MPDKVWIRCVRSVLIVGQGGAPVLISQAVLKVGTHPLTIVVVPAVTSIICDLIHNRITLPPDATAMDLLRAVDAISDGDPHPAESHEAP